MADEPKRRPIWVRPVLLRRVEALKLIPEEPAWKVLERLLDEHDEHSSGGTAAGASATSRGPLRRLADKFTGHADGDASRDQTTSLGEAVSSP